MQIDLSRWSPAQQDAILSREGNLLVSAGAGSGKTSVLVERVVHAVVGPTALDINQLLIVTFTEAAAAEMRQRIALRLQHLYEAARLTGRDDLSRHLERQLMLLEQAHISTLHSFCLEIVRRNFLFLQRDPKWNLLDDESGRMMRTELVAALVESTLSRGDGAAYAQLISRYGGDVAQFVGLLLRIHNFTRSQVDPDGWLSEMAKAYRDAETQSLQEVLWHAAFSAWVQRAVGDALLAAGQGAKAAGGDDELSKYADNLLEMTALLESTKRALGESNWSSVAAHLQALSSLKSPRAKDVPAKQQVVDCRKRVIAILEPVFEVLSRGEPALLGDICNLAEDMERLSLLVSTFEHDYQERKRERGVLDFNDLEHLALAVLRDRKSGEWYRVSENYREVFVDEYQDTSPIQDAIVQSVAGIHANVFVVGDIKQSIYRFRMAEPQLFMDKYTSYSEHHKGRVIDLRDNYRSRDDVVNAVNFFFEQIFQTEFGGLHYDERNRMYAGAKYPENSNIDASLSLPVEFHLVERSVDYMEDENEEYGKVTAIEKEAQVIATRIRKWMGGDGKPPRQVWDATLGAYRAMAFRDVAILLRSARGRVAPMLAVLARNGIPAYGATSSGFYDALETKWVMAALRAIDNPRRDVDFTTLLRSPIAGFSDEDLALIRTHHNGRFYTAFQSVYRLEATEHGELRKRVRRFQQQFLKWRRLSRRAGVAEVLYRVLEDTGLLFYLQGMTNGDVRKANVELFIDKARAYDETSFDGVYGFVDRLRQLEEQNVDAGEARTLGEHEDVVRIMTIHHSKGLEFPVVFVADCGKIFYRPAQERSFLLHARLGLAAVFVDMQHRQRWRTVPLLAIEEADYREMLEEEARVLYVAVTRAREHLVIVASATNVEKRLAKVVDSWDPAVLSLPTSTLLAAHSYLDWLLPALLRHRDGQSLRAHADSAMPVVVREDAVFQHSSRFCVKLWNLPNTDKIQGPLDEVPVEVDLPSLRLRGELVESLIQDKPELSIDLPWRLNTLVGKETTPGKISATELRRIWNAKSAKEKQTGGKRWMTSASARHLLSVPEFATSASTPISGNVTGTAFHAVMQYIAFGADPNPEFINKALDELVTTAKIEPNQRSMVDVLQIITFLTSPIGRRLSQASTVLREQPYYSRIELDNGQFVVNQGVIDVVAKDDEGWFIVDYKTDKVRIEDVQQKALEYRAQVAAYVHALESSFHPQVNDVNIQAYIHFVLPGVSVAVESFDVKRIFAL